MSTEALEMPASPERAEARPAGRTGLTFKRHFTKVGRHPYDEVTWELRSAVINDERGQPVFEQGQVALQRTPHRAGAFAARLAQFQEVFQAIAQDDRGVDRQVAQSIRRPVEQASTD